MGDKLRPVSAFNFVASCFNSTSETRIESPTAAIVFCRTRTEVDELTETLNARGYASEALHGGMTQEQRDKVMRKLREVAFQPGQFFRDVGPIGEE